MLLIRIYILAGLMVHKLVWEVFKRQRGGSPRSRSADPAGLRIIRLVKIGVLLGIAVQTLIPPGVRVVQGVLAVNGQDLRPARQFFDNFPQQPSTRVGLRSTPKQDHSTKLPRPSKTLTLLK